MKQVLGEKITNIETCKNMLDIVYSIDDKKMYFDVCYSGSDIGIMGWECDKNPEKAIATERIVKAWCEGFVQGKLDK